MTRRVDDQGRLIVCQACLLGLDEASPEPVLTRRPLCGHRLCDDCSLDDVCDRCHTAATRPGSWEAAEEPPHYASCRCDFCRILNKGCRCESCVTRPAGCTPPRQGGFPFLN